MAQVEAIADLLVARSARTPDRPDHVPGDPRPAPAGGRRIRAERRRDRRRRPPRSRAWRPRRWTVCERSSRALGVQRARHAVRGSEAAGAPFRAASGRICEDQWRLGDETFERLLERAARSHRRTAPRARFRPGLDRRPGRARRDHDPRSRRHRRAPAATQRLRAPARSHPLHDLGRGMSTCSCPTPARRRSSATPSSWRTRSWPRRRSSANSPRSGGSNRCRRKATSSEDSHSICHRHCRPGSGVKRCGGSPRRRSWSRSTRTTSPSSATRTRCRDAASAPLPRVSLATYGDDLATTGDRVAAFASILEEPADDSGPAPPHAALRGGIASTSANEGRGAMWIDAVNDVDRSDVRSASRPTRSGPAHVHVPRRATIPLRMGDPGERVLNVRVELASGRVEFLDGNERPVRLDRAEPGRSPSEPR